MDASISSAPVRQLTPELKYRLLLQIAERVKGTLELEEVLNHLIETLKSIVTYDAAGIFVLNRVVLPVVPGRGENMIAGVASRGFPTPHSQNDPMLRFGQGIIGQVIKTGQSVVSPDVRFNPHYVPGRPQTQSEIAVPLVSNGKVIGALNLESDRLGTYSPDDVDALQFFASAATIAIERAILHNQLLEKRRLEGQLRIAREVQTSLLPEAPPAIPGYDFAGINLPTWEIGGDCYDYIEFPTGPVGIAVADVSGKGVPAALIMATFRAALRTQVRVDHEVPHVMQAVNRLLWESIGRAAFVTAVYGVLVPENGRFVYSNCGHNPPLLLDRKGDVRSLDRGGPALGVFEEAQFESDAVRLEPGETLALYTDGVVEAVDEGNREFGEERLGRVLQSTAHLSAAETIAAIVDHTRAFAGHDSYPDDFTAVVIKRKP
jgi:sigma-B regulation protein RsbU (phosphoserine phosphatase)